MNNKICVTMIPTMRTEVVVNNADTLLIYQYENHDDDKPSNIIVIPRYSIDKFLESIISALDESFDVDDEVEI